MDLKLDKESNDYVPLSLISKFCDSRLQELTSQCPGESLSSSSKANSLYSDVLTSSSSSYKPKRREHQSSSASFSDPCTASNNTDFGNADAQNLRIKRNLTVSKHIKSHKLSEFVNTETIDDDDDDDIQVIEKNNGESSKTSGCSSKLNEFGGNIRERLESYLPALHQRISNGKWAALMILPNLSDLALRSPSPGEQDEGSTASGENNTPKSERYTWDPEQALLISSTNDVTVFFGIIDKPHSVKSQRLKKLYDHIGVVSLPLQSMATNPKLLYLLDGTGRIKLNDVSGKLKYGKVVSGIAVAIIGKVSRATLNVEDVIFATPCPPEWPIPQECNIEMIFLSGLFIGNEDGSQLALGLLQDYLLGLSGSAYEQEHIQAARSRLVILGNMISKSVSGQKSSSVDKVTKTCKRSMEKLEDFLEPLLHSMEVFLVPGENDLTFTTTLPQPPIHPQLLPDLAQFPTLKRLTNPARIEVSASPSQSNPQSQGSVSSNQSLMENSYSEFLKEDVHFLDMVLQSGKNVKHTMEYCDIPCPLEMGRRLLKWAHLHPTSCDTSDLAQNTFRIHGVSPHLMVMGNLSEFKSVEWNGTKVIGVPSFQKTQTVVVLTKDFDVIPLQFQLV